MTSEICASNWCIFDINQICFFHLRNCGKYCAWNWKRKCTFAHWGEKVNIKMLLHQNTCVRIVTGIIFSSWWRHQMGTFAICAGNALVTGEFPTQRPVTRSFDVFFDLCPNERLSKQSWGWWFETPLRPLWRHNNVLPSRLFYLCTRSQFTTLKQ